ncbi:MULTISPECIES: MrcB family domain-containing protein [Micrococcaceae]|uniref:MrcB family domain-containing protein n=1 Tax=Micrococcaceae TaxID=1268 RepID=UPI0009E8F3B7|nr:DUF3578 domain-containing protein [Arthrobacter sp. Soil761]
MRDEIQEILLLQKNYSAANTDAMQRRGTLVRRGLPAKIREHIANVSSEGRIDDFRVEGSDGIGRKTEIPWVRVHSKVFSPKPTSGWYAVYLFSSRGERAYLSLIQGTTYWNGGEFKPRPKNELVSRVQWARESLGFAETPPEGWTFDMRLDGRPGGLGDGYELGSVVAAEYPVSTLPQDEDLVKRLAQATTWLETLYGLEDDGFFVPGDTAPEVADGHTAIENMAGKNRRGQGFLLTAAERRAIESRAVDEATRHFEELGYVVKDVSGRQSYDLHVSKQDCELMVEVKGTTSRATDIFLTRNEVRLHLDAYPRNALAIVHSIILDRTGDEPKASGGMLDVKQPWQLDEGRLTPMAYRYSVHP